MGDRLKFERRSKALKEGAELLEATVTNELITRGRVENLELWVKAFVARGFFGRLKWLIVGK